MSSFYYVIDLHNHCVHCIHRNKDVAEGIANTTQMVVHQCSGDSNFLIYSIERSNLNDFPNFDEKVECDNIPESFNHFSWGEPDHEGIAKERMAINVNELIKRYTPITADNAISFAEDMNGVMDEYDKYSVGFGDKKFPFTHHSISREKYNTPEIVYHIVIDLAKF